MAYAYLFKYIIIGDTELQEETRVSAILDLTLTNREELVNGLEKRRSAGGAYADHGLTGASATPLLQLNLHLKTVCGCQPPPRPPEVPISCSHMPTLGSQQSLSNIAAPADSPPGLSGTAATSAHPLLHFFNTFFCSAFQSVVHIPPAKVLKYHQWYTYHGLQSPVLSNCFLPIIFLEEV
ncbi:ras-related protein Rab-2A isoform X2 [Crotalus tigris]|uniref:ras-related protein Rab-2A isoform X2 n=1 Tax=Crotalus tigris TaxID=88082 RepID=UPI00192F7473|nr:ras-related protein Rab-2A isoform X2 [Crotalus tigris]